MTEEILEKAIEIEGLIRIIKDGNPTAETYTLLQKKAAQLYEMTRSLHEDGNEVNTSKVNNKEEVLAATIPESALQLEQEDDVRMEEAEEQEKDEILLSLGNDDNETDTKPGASNLKSAFSLNDRFLYSRELFDGNMKMFDSTINSLEGIDDFAVVEEYFYNELEWDKGNPYVESFMERLHTKF